MLCELRALLTGLPTRVLLQTGECEVYTGLAGHDQL